MEGIRYGIILCTVAIVQTFGLSATLETGTATTTVLSTSPNPARFGQAVTLTATVTPSAATGTVTFLDIEAGTVLGTETLSGGVATLTTSSLPVGMRPIVAVYGGDATYSGSGSETQLQEITPAAANGDVAASGSPFAVGTQPYSVALGDFNRDGKLDLAVANNVDRNVTVLLGNGTGGFTAAIGNPFGVGAGPINLVAGDFDGDGKLDLAVANHSGNSVTVLLGDGTGNFGPAGNGPFPAGSGPISIAVGDFNGDGKLDLAIADEASSNNLTVLLGDGTGNFTAASGSPFTAGALPVSVAAGDFNGDGKLDLVVANINTHTVRLMLGDGTGKFTEAGGSPYVTGSEPYSVAVGDFNGDGKLDLATANFGANTVTVLLGDGTGKFTYDIGNPYPAGTDPYSVAVGDFNGDGKLDLAVANYGGNNVTMLLGDGTGGFAAASGSPLTVGSGPTSVAAGDFNGDGMVDLVTPNYLSDNVTVLLGELITSASISSSVNPSTYGQAVSFTATMTPMGATGSVQFAVDGANLGSPVAVSGGMATSATLSTLPAGSHSVTANFTGSSPMALSSSGTLSGGQEVNPAAVTAIVTAANKTYDGTTAATITSCTLSGVLATDTGNVTCAAGAASFSNASPGYGKTVTATGITLSGPAKGDYTLSSTMASATATITGTTAITGVNSTTADGAYGIGSTIAITIVFSGAVTVTGVPQLALNSGGTAGYSSGSGTSTLTFHYIVGAGQGSPRLDALSSTSLSLNGGTITDGSSNPANLMLPAPGGTGSLGANADVVISPLRFVPVTPCRVADTRQAAGPFGGPSIAGGASRSFTIPNGACSIPSSAQAYSLNVAVVPPGPLGYLTLWPSGQPQPVAATLNSTDGRIKSNAAIVPAGTNGAISVFASNATNVVLDINGYFVPASTAGALAYFPVTPCRIADTRKPNAPLAGPALAAGQSRTFPIQASACGIPSAAQAYSLNFAAVPPGPLGYITAFPTGQSQPRAATLNDATGTVAANAAIVQAGTSGSIDIFASNNTNLVIDIDGYFAPMAAGGLSLYNVTPCRVLDSRKPTGTPPFSGEKDIQISGVCGAPAAAQAYVLSATVAPAGALGFLTLWPQGETRPTAATLNAVDGAITNNLALVPTNNGSIGAWATNATQLILDIFGYFAQ